MAILLKTNRGSRKKALSAEDAKLSFGRIIDMARAEPLVVEKHGRPVVVVVAHEEYERLKELENARPNRSPLSTTGKRTAAK